MNSLEKLGWIAEVITAILTILLYAIGETPNMLKGASAILATVILVTLIANVIYTRPQRILAASSRFDPKLKHIEARLFYPPASRLKRLLHLERRETNPRKKNPRNKLILVKDLKKAYYVGAYAWDLIIRGKIEWFSETDQDLQKWCDEQGYTLIPEAACRDGLLEPYFVAEIVDKKAKYRRKETVLFRTHYRGKLINGFFDNQIILPDGAHSWSWDPSTLANEHPATPGKLNGYVDRQSPQWGWVIKPDAPSGEYRVYMRVYNHYPSNKREPVGQREDTFDVA